MEMKIYTKQGDKGSTGLLGGHKVKKNHERLDAYGSIDELNSWVGMIRSYPIPDTELNILIQIQHRLFIIGSYLAYDEENATKPVSNLPMVSDEQVSFLEQEIDRMNDSLPNLSNFIMPGGDPQSSACHLARTVCRRSERRVVALSESVEINSVIIRYLNRLSDYFFILARYLSHQHKTKEILWKNDV
ncbi:MAG: cob(I)yrinic acid a,c-diamide adenosyltransferase [Bacteroidota bacterium]|nr:cob(I)yrinic acid a,c-diamide adenosyltransferase [Bacteroidota bacterium]